MISLRSLFASLVLLPAITHAQPRPRWWMDEPVRFIQTNLPETYSTLDPKRLADQLAEYPANVLLFNMGGIVAQYPTRVEFHYPSPHLPPGKDLFGDMVREAHARKIRVVGRFDLSKTQKPVFDTHPEWFFKRTNGEPAIYNGLYSACINGGYYHEHAPKILAEALERYEVDGLFFNMFGNPSSDYSGQPMGPCQCDACKAKFTAKFNRPLPASSQDPDYRLFMDESAREVARMISELIHRIRPNAAFLTYIQDYTDGIMSESNTSVTRALPMWPYSASDNVNRARNSEPDKMSFNLCMSFVDYMWRFITVPPAEIQLRLWQNLAHGGPPALVVVGNLDQEDRQSLIAAKPIFEFHKKHEDLYVGQTSAARVLLLTGNINSYRGFFRLLSEEHIPFVVSTNMKWLQDAPRTFDLVIAPSGASPELERYVRGGGKLLVSGSTPPFGIGSAVAQRPATQGAWRIHDHSILPSLKETNLIFLDGEFAELSPLEKSLLTLIPPAMFGPPEKVWVDKVETRIPGLVIKELDKGKIAYIPWDVGGSYYRHSSQGHSGLMKDVIDHLLGPDGRQIKTNAHPLVEITVMKQPAKNRTLIHLVNLSGHSDTAYFAPIEMRDIFIGLKGEHRTARAVGANQPLLLESLRSSQRLTLPVLKGYEVIVLE